MDSLPERLRLLLVRLRKAADRDLPDPDSLLSGGEVEIYGRKAVVRSSVPLDEITKEDSVTIYIHIKPGDDETGRVEILRYLQYEARSDLSSIFIVMTRKDGDLEQSVTMKALPREIVMANIDRALGRGGGDRRRGRQQQMMRRGAGGGRGRGGGGQQQRQPFSFGNNDENYASDSESQ